MKPNMTKAGIALVICFLSISFIPREAKSQMKWRVFFYSEALGGYGNIFDRFKVTTPGPTGPVTAWHHQSHGNGLTVDLKEGGTLSKSKHVAKYSYFDFFLNHRQLFSNELFYSFSGGGVQGRYLWGSANLVLGYMNSSMEVPNKRYEDNILGYGPMDRFCWGFGVGFNKPVKYRSPLILRWDINMLFPRAPHDDLTGYLNYKWFNTSLGFRYYISRIR